MKAKGKKQQFYHTHVPIDNFLKSLSKIKLAKRIPTRLHQSQDVRYMVIGVGLSFVFVEN